MFQVYVRDVLATTFHESPRCELPQKQGGVRQPKALEEAGWGGTRRARKVHGCFAAPAERLKRTTWRVGRLIMIKQSASTTGAVLGASGAPVLALLAGSLAAAPSLFPQAGLAPGTGGLFADLAAAKLARRRRHASPHSGNRRQRSVRDRCLSKNANHHTTRAASLVKHASSKAERKSCPGSGVRANRSAGTCPE